MTHYGAAVAGVLAAVVIAQLLCAAFGYVLGRDRGRPLLGTLLGYVFGVIGLFLLVLALPRPQPPIRGSSA